MPSVREVEGPDPLVVAARLIFASLPSISDQAPKKALAQHVHVETVKVVKEIKKQIQESLFT